MKAIFFLVFVMSGLKCFSQEPILKPGFDPVEYNQLLDLNAQFIDTPSRTTRPPAPPGYTQLYRSPEMGLKNRWDLWMREDGVAIISIRGTVSDPSSWLENFYAAMIPATGNLKINDSTRFQYKLAENTQAAVHAGWMLGLAHLAPDIVKKIRELNEQKRTREFLIMGHSQGGAIAFLLRSYLYYLEQVRVLQDSIHFKTYCSAAPKPGNLYYAYDFDFINRNGWAYTIVNALDWVPETPFSIQTFSDFNEINPFNSFNQMIRKQKILVRWYLGGKFKKMNRNTRKSRHTMDTYLGHEVFKQVHKALPQFEEPAYAGTANYSKAGSPIVLQPEPDYLDQFPQNPGNIFINHSFHAYKILLSKYYRTF